MLRADSQTPVQDADKMLAHQKVEENLRRKKEQGILGAGNHPEKKGRPDARD